MRWSTNAILKTHTDTTRVQWQQSDYTMLSNRLFLLSLLSCDSRNCCHHVVLVLRAEGKREFFMFHAFSYVHDFSTRKPGIIAKCIMCLKFFLMFFMLQCECMWILFFIFQLFYNSPSLALRKIAIKQNVGTHEKKNYIFFGMKPSEREQKERKEKLVD